VSQVTLTDTGPLVALVNRNDPNHFRCLNASKGLPAGPLLTTWPCLTEAMYLAYRVGGYPAQAALWALRTGGKLVLHDLTLPEIDRIAESMKKYRDTPMDLTDASLVAAAESIGLHRVFTLDSHFYTYRFTDGTVSEVFPQA
jgi:predicted nucleic acid-binding protein